MMCSGNTLHLTRGGEALAILHLDGQQLLTTTAFEPLRPLFERESELLDVDEEEANTEWADIWDELDTQKMFVESPDGTERVDIAWIHFRQNRAWWFPLYASPLTIVRSKW
jgi:hypothetical protein